MLLSENAFRVPVLLAVSIVCNNSVVYSICSATLRRNYVLVIFWNTPKRIATILVSLESSHCLPCKYVGFIAQKPLISDKLGLDSMGEHERFQGNCEV